METFNPHPAGLGDDRKLHIKQHEPLQPFKQRVIPLMVYRGKLGGIEVCC